MLWVLVARRHTVSFLIFLQQLFIPFFLSPSIFHTECLLAPRERVLMPRVCRFKVTLGSSAFRPGKRKEMFF